MNCPFQKSNMKEKQVAYIIVLSVSTGLLTADDLLCDKKYFDRYISTNCIHAFNQSVRFVDYRERCPWPDIKDPYKNLTDCVKLSSKLSQCEGPSFRDDFFLEIHRAYFSLCVHIQDPGTPTLLLLILPCILTTLLLPFFCIHVVKDPQRQ